MPLKLVAVDGQTRTETAIEPITALLISTIPPIQDRIRSYLAFPADNRYLNYDPSQIGVYRIVGADEGFNASPPRPDLGLYHGRFIDVIAKAVEKSCFYPNETITIPHTIVCGQIYHETVIALPEVQELSDLLQK